MTLIAFVSRTISPVPNKDAIGATSNNFVEIFRQQVSNLSIQAQRGGLWSTGGENR
jgi:hypothetical protein